MIDKYYRNRIKDSLSFIFDKDYDDIYSEIISLVESHISNKVSQPLTERDAFLITYGDSLNNHPEMPMKTLNEFSNKYFKDIFSYIHILPFYPYSSDDGFSVIDYYKVNESLGNWDDVQSLSDSFKLMFDGVINHISAKSEWFREYLKGNPKYSDYFNV